MDYASDVNPAHSAVISGGNLLVVDKTALTESLFQSDGWIATKASATGGQTNFSYSPSDLSANPVVAGLLQSVTDSFGRTVSFTYEQPPMAQLAHIRTLTASDGAVTTFNYSQDAGNLQNLQSIVWPDQASQTFLYEQSDIPWALTGVLDENGARFETMTYDATGRATSTQEGAGIDKYVANYDPDPKIAPHWQLTEFLDESVPVVCRIHSLVTSPTQLLQLPNGQQVTLQTTTINGSPNSAGQTQPAGSGSGAVTSSQMRDVNGNLVVYDDFNGNRSCYAYDTSRNVRTYALEGLPSSKTCPASLISYAPSISDAAHPERKTSILWHPDWDLMTRQAQPRKLTTWVYNGQVDPISGATVNCVTPAATLPDGKPLAVLCTRYEQATTDATGASGLSAAVVGPLRSWTYSYDQFGNVLTQTTPKRSSTDTTSHTTTYTYYSTTSFSGNAGYTLGDLQSVTNPLGQTTTFTSYDKAGRLLSSTDSNGVVTTQSYFARGWLKSQTVTSATGAALTTTYGYWPTGLLETVTLPDATALSYSYDSAHRLTDVVDGAGNKVHYVLDNVGNRTSEQVSDASGNLAASVARVFDALNRVQSTTGALH